MPNTGRQKNRTLRSSAESARRFLALRSGKAVKTVYGYESHSRGTRVDHHTHGSPKIHADDCTVFYSRRVFCSCGAYTP